MIPTLPHDKAMHAVYGSLAAFVGALAGVALALPLWQPALALAAAVAVGKEVYDKATGRGTPDWWLDVVATLAGAAPLIAVSAISAA